MYNTVFLHTLLLKSSVGHRYLWGMSSIHVTVPIVFWGCWPPSHACSICKPDNRSGMATGCRSGQICIWDLHKRHTTGETVVRLSGDLILQVLKFKISSHLSFFLTDWPQHYVLKGHTGKITCLLYPCDYSTAYNSNHLLSGGADFSVRGYGTCTREYWCTRLLCMEED